MFPLHNKSRGSSMSTTSSQLPGPSSRHARLLRQFNEDIFKRHVLTDVELVVDGKVFKCHRALLVCFSPALKRKLLGSDGKPITKKIHVSKVSSKDFDILLQYMYTGDLNVTCENFYDVYKAASILEMQEVLHECFQVLESRNDIRTYFYIYVTAKKMGVQANWIRALKLLTHRFEEAICAPEFLQLEVNFVIEMLSAQTIGARSEVLVFLAALNWLNYDYANREEHAVKVMECVRFSTMTMDEIVACYHPPFLPQLLDKTEIVMHLFRATCYITAKFLGQQAWFKHFGRQKRNLVFENLPFELWHQKGPPTISNIDLALNWHKPTELDQASSRLEVVKLDSSAGHFPNGYITDIERMKLEHENGAHHQDPFPRESFQYFGSMQQQQHPFQKLPNANPKTQCYSTTNLTVAVQKVFQECAQTSENAVNVAEVVKKVLEEINSDEWKGRNAADKVLDTQDRVDSTEVKKEINESNSGPSRQILPFKARSSPDRIEGQTFQDKKSSGTQKPNLQDSKNKIPLNSSSEKNSSYKEKKNSHQEAEPFEIIIPHTTSSREFKDPDVDSDTKSMTDSPEEKQFQFPIVNKSRKSSRNLRDESVQKFLSSKQPINAKGPQISERLPSKAVLTSNSSIDVHEKEDRSSSVMLTPETPEFKFKKVKPSILVIGGMNPRNLQTGTGSDILNYNSKKNKWTICSTLPAPRHNHAAAFWNNCVYVIGGCDPLETKQQNRYIAKRSCYKLDINKQQWSSIQDMKFKRYDHGLAVLSGHIYAIGGQDDGERLLKTVEVYDIKKNKWKILPSEMCCGRKAMGTTAFSGKIWIAGGLIQADKEINFQVVSHVDCYDPKHKRWLFNVHSLPSPRCYCSLTVWMGQICCVGGMIRDAKDTMRPTDEVWFFNSDAEMWNYGPALPIPRMGSVALVYDRYIYVVGGFDPEADVAIRNVNRLAPGAISWEIVAALPSHLFGLGAVSCSE